MRLTNERVRQMVDFRSRFAHENFFPVSFQSPLFKTNVSSLCLSVSNLCTIFDAQKKRGDVFPETTRGACAGATCGDVELREIPLSLPREGGKDAGDAPPSGADDEGDDDDEEAGLLGSPKARASRGEAATTSSSTDASAGSGLLSRLPKGEAVMFCGTFILAFQNIVAKTVERTSRRCRWCSCEASSATLTSAPSTATHHVAKHDGDARLTRDLLPGRALCTAAIRVVGSIAFSLAYISLITSPSDSVAIFFLNLFSGMAGAGRRGRGGLAILCGLIGTLLIVKPPAMARCRALGEEETSMGTSPDPAGSPSRSSRRCAARCHGDHPRRRQTRSAALAGWFHAWHGDAPSPCWRSGRSRRSRQAPPSGRC